MKAKTRNRRVILAQRAQWVRDIGITRATSDYGRQRMLAELAALRWALRVIDAAPELADELVHHPDDDLEEDR